MTIINHRDSFLETRKISLENQEPEIIVTISDCGYRHTFKFASDSEFSNHDQIVELAKIAFQSGWNDKTDSIAKIERQKEIEKNYRIY